MSATHNTDAMSEFRDYVVLSSWTGSVSPATQDMLRLTTNGTDFLQQFLTTENQYRTALSVLSSAGATRDAALPELSDEEKLRVIEIARTMIVPPADLMNSCFIAPYRPTPVQDHRDIGHKALCPMSH